MTVALIALRGPMFIEGMASISHACQVILMLEHDDSGYLGLGRVGVDGAGNIRYPKGRGNYGLCCGLEDILCIRMSLHVFTLLARASFILLGPLGGGVILSQEHPSKDPCSYCTHPRTGLSLKDIGDRPELTLAHPLRIRSSSQKGVFCPQTHFSSSSPPSPLPY